MERIHVSVRSRPLPSEDAKSSPWRISSNSIFIPNQPTKFEFDRIFGEECKTKEVYTSRTKDIVAAAVRGFNGTVFAYGQTNSGKTHTMRGSSTEPGIIPLAVHDLFGIIQQEMGREFLLRMSYMEIYNEEINDLLAPNHRKLQIHESIERGIFVAGLREEIVASPEQVLELMEFGESHRHFGETNMNAYSSRSHTIFRMIIESREKTEEEAMDSSCDAVRVSVLNLVDLAGSERATKTGAEGVRLKEGSHINKSLMTLGTVIKKLSEGAESQGSHVPYRDSKLTRILQPALGGNANTAIICNITVEQLHADETKSSLQFASRALRVTNCVHVNEILTDAALLKRQKKEIEELRAKLQGSHSEHFEEEILNLRNTLLKTELERERIALELEEEKKSQAEREKRLQEQAKKIENLSSMVLCSNRDENHDQFKKVKRRDTWCPGNLSRETLAELNHKVQEQASTVKPSRGGREMGPLLPFEELVDEARMDDPCKQEEDCDNKASGNSTIPNLNSLLHVTSRRKPPLRKKSLPVEKNEQEKIQAEYEDLLLEFETQKTMHEIQIDYLTRKLCAVEFYRDEKCNGDFPFYITDGTIHGNSNNNLTEVEAILLIKQLQEKITMLEMDKSSSQENFDCVVELATEQNLCAKKKYEELYEELLNVREEAKVACEQLAAVGSVRTTGDENCESLINLVPGINEIIVEVQNSRNLVEVVSSFVDELFQSFSAVSNVHTNLRSWAFENALQIKSIIGKHESLQLYMKQKIDDLENEKLLLRDESMDLQNTIQKLSVNVQNSAEEINELLKQHELEKVTFLSEIKLLQKEVSCLSSSSLAREKENMRKDFEKTKSKLRETESKLRNAIQEKTKLEGEKAFAEREIKHLHGQKVILERDICKRDSVVGRRRDSVADRSSNVFDPKRGKSISIPIDQTMQEEYKKLEVLAFEMESTIVSLEEELAIANGDKDEAVSRSESLEAELHLLSKKLDMSNSELSMLQEEVSTRRSTMEESISDNQKLKSSIKMLVEEKEELAMQLTDALLAMEEENAISSAKERASIEAIEEKTKLYNTEIMLLSNAISEVRDELVSCRNECHILEERLTNSESTAEVVKVCSKEKSLENDRLRDELMMAEDQSKRSQEIWKSKLEALSLEHFHACEEVDKLKMELSGLSKEQEALSAQNLGNQLLIVTKERDELMTRIKKQNFEFVQLFSTFKAKSILTEMTGKLSDLGKKRHSDEVNGNKEKAKLRMRLKGAQAKLDGFRVRYIEAVDEMDFMNKKYEDASTKLKDQLASYAMDVLNLRKQIVTSKPLV